MLYGWSTWIVSIVARFYRTLTHALSLEIVVQMGRMKMWTISNDESKVKQNIRENTNKNQQEVAEEFGRNKTRAKIYANIMENTMCLSTTAE